VHVPPATVQRQQDLMKVRRLRSALANSVDVPGQARRVGATSFNFIAYLIVASYPAGRTGPTAKAPATDLRCCCAAAGPRRTDWTAATCSRSARQRSGRAPV